MKINVYEFKSVKIDGNKYDIDVHDLEYTMDITDHNDDYCFGESAQVITDIDFDLVTIEIFNRLESFDVWHSRWAYIKKQVSEHILDDHEFMQEWQDREFKE